jgi:peptidoglycan/xylan/chitin deacetylase (PgdA/CDA1 family)
MSKSSRYPRTWQWPGDARIALTIGVPFEDFNFQSQLSLVGTPGKLDRFSLSYGDYGWKAGIWRLLDVLDEFGLKASMSTNGLAAERHPEIVRSFVDEGHEVLGHGWANDFYAKDAGPDAEREEIRKCTEVLTSVCGGVRPVGWTSPGSSGSDMTIELLREHGYLWYGDDASDDLPFLTQTSKGPFVVLPRTNMSTNDITQWLFPRNPPSVLLENFKDTFDQLYSEGVAGSPKWIDITLHAHMAGRATLTPTIKRMLAYSQQHEGVFYTRKRDIAEYTLQRLSGA